MRVLKGAIGTLVLVLIVVAIAALAHYLSRPGMFPIKTVQVQGDYQFVTKPAIAQTVTPFVNNGFFHVAVVKAQLALDNLPGVKDSTIRRVWPDTVVVTLVEQKTIGRWPDGRLLTDEGMLFTPVSPGLGNNLPLFTGAAEDSVLMSDTYQKLMPLLQYAPLVVKEISYQHGTGFRLITQDGVTITLGLINIPERLNRLIHAWPQLLASNTKQIPDFIDMQYKNGFAVSWKAKPKPINVKK